MKAVYASSPGPAANLVYGELPTPTPGPGQALVKIVTSGVTSSMSTSEPDSTKPTRPSNSAWKRLEWWKPSPLT